MIFESNVMLDISVQHRTRYFLSICEIMQIFTRQSPNTHSKLIRDLDATRIHNYTMIFMLKLSNKMGTQRS